MQLRVGFEMAYQCYQDTPMIAQLNIHYSRASDLLHPDYLTTTPAVPLHAYRDSFGNWCTRLVAPAGLFVLRSDTVLNDSGAPDEVVPHAPQAAISELPESTLVYLLGSRYCETDQLVNVAWDRFGSTTPGWPRVQAICDFVHRHIEFGYHHARRTRTAWEAYNEGQGVCRDYAHLAVALCRCMNIPARYCSGYITDIGVPLPWTAMDFAGWFEAFLGDRWHVFDPRNNTPRIGRVLMARGRDACDTALTTSFAANTLASFKVWADEYTGPTQA
jgi:transglutaminase-like putative cysteine protease